MNNDDESSNNNIGASSSYLQSLRGMRDPLADLPSLGGVQKQLAELQALGGIREQLADLSSLGGVQKQLADWHPLGGMRDQLAELQALGGMHEQLADLSSLGGVQKQLADLHPLGGVREQLADLSSLGGVQKQLADWHPLSGMRDQLAELQALGGMHEQLADLSSLGGVQKQLADLHPLGGMREQLADWHPLGGMREQLADLRALTAVHEWASVTGIRQRLEEINFEVGTAGLKQRMADLNGVAGINWSSRLVELQTLSPIIAGLSANSEIPFDDYLFRTAYEVAAYSGLQQKNEGQDRSYQLYADNESQNNPQPQNFSDLPLQIQNFILKFIYDLLIALLASFLVLATQEKYFSKVESSNDPISPREVRKLARCENSWEREALSQCRLVSGYDVKLRSKPNQKSYELATLPLGSTLKIIDTYNRSWLKVEVVSEDIAVEGWVLRRYTEYFR